MDDDDWFHLNQDADTMMDELCCIATKVKEIFDKLKDEGTKAV